MDKMRNVRPYSGECRENRCAVPELYYGDDR